MGAGTAIPPQWVITEPGIIDGMPAEIYHGDPVAYGSLSSSGARKLLPPHCPAAFRWGEEKPTTAMQRGTAAHTVLLGSGPELVVCDFPDWRKGDAQRQRDAALARGAIPLLPHQREAIDAMTAALERHESARQLFKPGSGQAEQSAFWRDDEFGIWRRCRFDFLPYGTGGTLYIPDYKTTDSAAEEAMAKSMANYGYHLQAAYYRDAARYFRPGVEVKFILVAQETKAPYLVETYEVHPDAMAEGAWWNRVAMEIFRDCMESGSWPGYNPEQTVTLLDLPRWAYRGRDW